MLKRLVICLYFALCLDPNLYEECKELCSQTKGLIACDGSFPICVGQAFPIDGLGKQHHVIDVGFVMTGSVTSRKIIAASNHLSPPDQHSSKIFYFFEDKSFLALCSLYHRQQYFTRCLGETSNSSSITLAYRIFFIFLLVIYKCLASLRLKRP